MTRAAGTGGQQPVAERVEPERRGMDTQLRPWRVLVQAERAEEVVAEEATVVGLRPAERPFEVGERAVRAGQVHREDRQRHRGVQQDQPRPPDGEQRAGKHQQHGQPVHDGDP